MATRTPSAQLTTDLESLRQLLPGLRTQKLRDVVETAPPAMDQTASLEILRNQNVFIPLRMGEDGMNLRAIMWSHGSGAILTIQTDIAIYELDQEPDIRQIVDEAKNPGLAQTAYQGVKLSLVPGSEKTVITAFGIPNVVFPARVVYDTPVKLRGGRQKFLYVRTNQPGNALFPIPVSADHASGAADPWFIRAYSSSGANGQQFPNPVRFDSNVNVTPAFMLLSSEALQRYFF